MSEPRSSAAEVVTQQTEWVQVKAHAVAGELRFEPAAAEGCALACEELIDHMEGQLQTATLLSNVDGFGHTVVGSALPRKFATQTEEAVKVLTAHRALLTDMASTNCQTAENDTATGGSNAHGMTGAHEMVGNVGVGGRGCRGGALGTQITTRARAADPNAALAWRLSISWVMPRRSC